MLDPGDGSAEAVHSSVYVQLKQKFQREKHDCSQESKRIFCISELVYLLQLKGFRKPVIPRIGN